MISETVLQVVMTAFATGTVGSVVGWLAARPKTRAEVASIASETTGKLLDRLEKQNRELLGRIQELEERANDDRLRVMELDQHVWTLTLYARRAWSELGPEARDELGPVPMLYRAGSTREG